MLVNVQPQIRKRWDAGKMLMSLREAGQDGKIPASPAPVHIFSLKRSLWPSCINAALTKVQIIWHPHTTEPVYWTCLWTRSGQEQTGSICSMKKEKKCNQNTCFPLCDYVSKMPANPEMLTPLWIELPFFFCTVTFQAVFVNVAPCCHARSFPEFPGVDTFPRVSC